MEDDLTRQGLSRRHMPQTEHYSKNYRILGIQPGVSWKQLRHAYKKLVNTWHPDRFHHDGHQKKLAEEKTKEITQAYKELAEYYKEFSALPHVAKMADVAGTEKTSSQKAYNAHPDTESLNTEPAVTLATATTVQAPKRRLKSFVRVIAAAALAAATYFVWQFMPGEPYANRPMNVEGADQATDKQDDKNLNHYAVSKKYFTMGSSLGEVYSIQGVPTKTEKDIWYYGSSRVYFFKGKVMRWEESSDFPLRVTITPEMEKSDIRFFGEGSSKEEVLAAQGAPDHDAGNAWDYGLSRVYFEDNRVKGWNETPHNPLRVRR
ncbi:MAG TPA: DnaJ domain-containing protein [Anaerolineales bacterium]|nr:DnaJ domain-containing protein [Anaerolineales bacterium]